MNKGIIDAELWAIATGLDLAGKITLQNPQTAVTIFSDSREAINTLGQLSARTGTPCLRNLIYQKLSDLERKGKSVTLKWIPGHVGPVGHDKADQNAREKAQKGGKPVEQWSSLAYIKRKLTDSHAQELANWHITKTQERKTTQQGFYISRVEKGMSKILGHTAKKYASRYL